MTNNLYKTQSEKYEYISTQYGGYHRHDFVDHAYLYNLYFPVEPIFNILRNNIRNLVLNYPIAQKDLAGLLGKVISQPAERIVVGNGASELIKILSNKAGVKLIVPVPSFNEYVNASQDENNVVEFPLEFPSFELDVDKFASRAIEVKANVAVVVTPNNPTSMAISKTDIMRLANKLKSNNCKLIIDESFIDFAENSLQITMEREIDSFKNIAILKSMSKVYGICGLRIGYILTSDLKFADSIRSKIPIWNVNGFAEEILRILPNYKQEFIDSCRQVKEDCANLFRMICNIKGMTVFKPDANFIFCRLPDGAENAKIITKKLFIQHNIYIKDCSGKTLPDSDRYLRIASRTEAENRNLIAALTDIIQS